MKAMGSDKSHAQAPTWVPEHAGGVSGTPRGADQCKSQAGELATVGLGKVESLAFQPDLVTRARV
ncbi:hypothetical protein JOC24_002810 [Streptomyces sp. HB132]|nr:hypothetical protein [Streptomyces sp. HB132]